MPNRSWIRLLFCSALLRLVVRKDGDFRQVCLMGSTPVGYGFEQAAVQAVRQWQFEPATVDGESVEFHFIVYFGWSIP